MGQTGQTGKDSGGSPLAGALRLEAGVSSRDEFSAALKTTPLFASRSVVIVERAEKLGGLDGADELVATMLDGDPDRLVILHSAEAQKDVLKNKALAPIVAAKRAATFPEPQDARRAVAWVRDFAARNRIKIDLRAAERLVDHAGFRTNDLAQELRKLAFDGEGEITEKAVEECVARYAESPPAAWVEAVLARSPAAVRLVESIVGVERDLAKTMLPTIGLLNSRFADVDLLRSGADIAQEWRRDKARDLARRWSARDIARTREILLALDLDLKSRSADGHLARIELATARMIEGESEKPGVSPRWPGATSSSAG